VYVTNFLITCNRICCWSA